MRRNVPSRWHGEGGQGLLETGIMLAVIFSVVFSVFEIGQLMYTYAVLADAANEGVRYSIVHTGGDSSGTQARVLTFAKTSLHNVSAISTLVTFPDGTSTPPNRVRVAITYTYVPFLGKFAPTMKTYAEGRMVVQ